MSTSPSTPVIVTHGGAGAPAAFSDGAERAARSALGAQDALAAALHATVQLEDDSRFNAGTGSNYRLDGETIEMDAAVMTSDGRSGAVACIERVRNPILVAAEVRARTPHLMLVGAGATAFARRLGVVDYDPGTAERQADLKKAREALLRQADETASGDHRATDRSLGGWLGLPVKPVWNFAGDYPGDTVGAVARDARGEFAAAASTGGTLYTLRGRVGDTPLIGSGLYAGPAGAVACTGVGEEIVRRFLALRVYEALASGRDAQSACDEAVARFPKDIPVGILAVGPASAGAATNREMPWAMAQT